ncbi:hypothetical protein HY624_01955 [Candidatus Uhrbacteria bacterium]|nr:hypothetical protein [Candidatus Uhrbacteria bacterium]
MSDRNLIRLWRIVVGLAYLATAATILMNNGCTVAQRRIAVKSAETVGIAYTALLTSVATHELAGHIREDALAGRAPHHIRAKPRFYRLWELREDSDVGVKWETRSPFDSGIKLPGINWRYVPIGQRLLEQQIDRRITVHSALAGLGATSNLYTIYNESLRTGDVSGRFAHAYTLFLGMDATLYALHDYRDRGGKGDLLDYINAMGGSYEMLQTAFALDFVGKLPDMWWHMKGMCGINDPAPTFWRVGAWEIRPALVIIEWRAAPGFYATLSF